MAAIAEEEPTKCGRVVNETAREKEDEERNGKKNVSKEIVWQTTAIHPQERKKRRKNAHHKRRREIC